MNLPRVVRCLRAVVQAVIPQYLCYAQSVIREDALPAFGLNAAMGLKVSPEPHGLFVPPIRKRQDFSRRDKALEPLDRDEPLDLLQLRAQRGCRVEIGVCLTRMRYGFENHGDHVGAPGLDASLQNVPSTKVTNVRSSRTMNRFVCAMAKFARASESAFSR